MTLQDGGIYPAQVSTVEVSIPTLGDITGLCFDGKTCQYLGIPYATVPGRFRRPKPAPAWENKAFDGTKLGPYCPQPPRDFYPIPTPPRPWLENPPTSENQCLNLNISVPFPPEVIKSKSHRLPVMVFLHGGAFAYAAGSAAIYDGRGLAQISAAEEIPSIIVTINYRLGVLGFLAGRSLKAYNESFGEQGVGNYGLWDQVEALRWVQRHIAGFGGDPDRVTLFGQSAGGVSSNLHLLRNEPLFSSVILQSGLLPLCGIMTVDEYDVVYRKTLSVLDIPETLTEEEQLQRLLSVPEPELTASMIDVFMIPVVTLSPCDDGFILPSPMPSYSSFKSFQMPPWCPRVMVGDAGSETVIWGKSFRKALSSPAAVFSYTANMIGADPAKILLYDIYGLNSDLTPAETFEFVEKFTTDALYLAPNYDFFRACGRMGSPFACFAYHMEEPSHYDSAWHGRPHHSLENVFIWSLLRHTLPVEQQRQSQRMSQMWLQFANGISPWEEYQVAERMMVFGAPKSGEAELKTAEQDKARGYGRWLQVQEAGLMEQWGKLSDDICMRRRDLVDIKVKPQAMESLSVGLGKIEDKDEAQPEPGVL